MKKTSLILSCFSILFILGGGGCKTKSSGTSDLSQIEKEFREYFTDYKTLDEWIEIAKKNNYKEYKYDIPRDYIDIYLPFQKQTEIQEKYVAFKDEPRQTPIEITEEKFVFASQIQYYFENNFILYSEIAPPKEVFHYTEEDEKKSIFISSLMEHEVDESGGQINLLWIIYQKNRNFDDRNIYKFSPFTVTTINKHKRDDILKEQINELFDDNLDVKEAILNYLKNSPREGTIEVETIKSIEKKIDDNL